MSEEENNTSGFWLGMILGGAIGAVAGYLLSSKDKRQALEEIREKGKQLLENLGTFKDEIVEKGEKVKRVVEAEVEDIASEMEGVPQAAKEAIEKVEKAAQEAVKNISESVKTSNTYVDPRKKGFGKIFFKKGNALVKK